MMMLTNKRFVNFLSMLVIVDWFCDFCTICCNWREESKWLQYLVKSCWKQNNYEMKSLVSLLHWAKIPSPNQRKVFSWPTFFINKTFEFKARIFFPQQRNDLICSVSSILKSPIFCNVLTDQISEVIETNRIFDFSMIDLFFYFR